MMALETDLASVQSISLFVVLLCICILISHLLEKNRWINNTIVAQLMGFGAGVVILIITKRTSSLLFKFDEQLFFNYILPPIIFNAGFQVRKKQFFRNFSTITLFGAIGTLISFGVMTLGAFALFKTLNVGFSDMRDYLAIGAMFAASDSVSTLQVLNQEETPFVYSLVFGESVVNDATSVVLFNVIQRFEMSNIGLNVPLQFAAEFLYLFIASTLIGVFTGLLSASITKKLSLRWHSTVGEITIIILMAYLSYMMAELFNFSGILSVFFCGIVMSHYTCHNVSETSRTTIKEVFATMSFIAENFIFLYVGMDALDVERWTVGLHRVGTFVGMSTILLALVLIGRAASIFPLSFLNNLVRKDPDEIIEFRQQVVIWWAGLVRGSVTMALAYSQFAKSGHAQEDGNAIMITSTITVIFVTTLVFGILTKPLLGLLIPSSTLCSNKACLEPSNLESMTLPLLANLRDSDVAMAHSIANRSTLGMLFTKPTRTVHYYWRKFDHAFMLPLFRVSESTTEQKSIVKAYES